MERNATSDSGEGNGVRRLAGRISRVEAIVAATVAVVLFGLVVAEPAILEAPFENARTLGFSVGGTFVAAVALVVMLGLGVPPIARVVVLGVPFVAVSWWLISPFFVDDVVHDDFATSITAELARDDEPAGGDDMTTREGPTTAPAPPTTAPAAPTPEPSETSPPALATAPTTVAPTTVPIGPVLVGAGQFHGLAGHEGTGDAGFFRLDDGSHVLRFERFDIQNGPDLHVYVVPGADQVSIADAAVHLGSFRGNVGEQTYELPPDFIPARGSWTVLVWCEAFSVEFVGATVSVP